MYQKVYVVVYKEDGKEHIVANLTKPDPIFVDIKEYLTFISYENSEDAERLAGDLPNDYKDARVKAMYLTDEFNPEA